MLRALPTTLFVALSFVLAACTETFPVAGGSSAGGTTSSSSSAGAGGVGGHAGDSTGTGGVPTCDDTDGDGDGYSLCDKDCDDDNPFIHPGALEICGDGADEDCDGKDNTGEECASYTIYVSPLGNTGAKGTIDDPCLLVSEGVERATALGVPAAVLVAGGTYADDILVSGKVSLLGGYDPSDWNTRDPKAFETTLKSKVPEGVRLVGLDPEMFVDGFTIVGRSVSVDPAPSIALTIDGGGPIVSNAKILAGNVSVGNGASVGVRVVTQAATVGNPRLWLVDVRTGSATAGPAHGIFIDADGADVQLIGSVVKAGQGTDSIALFVERAGKVVAYRDSLQSGSAIGGVAQPSTSLAAWIKRGLFFLDSSVLNADQINDPPKCFTPSAWCGGARVSAASAYLSNNVVFGSASERSAALHLLEVEDDLADVVLTSNLFYAAGKLAVESVSAGVLLASPRADAVVTPVGRFRNDIFIGGTATYNYGFFEQHTPGESCDPAALDHNLFYFPVIDPNVGRLYSDWDGNNGSDLTTLDALPGTPNFEGDPLYTMGHIAPASPCHNAGTDVDAPDHDIEQNPRPQEGAYDIGPDELMLK